MKKSCTVLVFGLISWNFCFADNQNRLFLINKNWEHTTTEANGTRVRHTYFFSSEGTVTTSATCLYAEQDKGENVTVSVSGQAELSNDRILYLESKIEKRTNSVGLACTAFLKGGQEDQYLKFDDKTLLLTGTPFTLASRETSTIAGHKYKFSFMLNSNRLEIIQDLTIPDKIRTTATCFLAEPVSASIDAPAQIDEQGMSMENPTAFASEKEFDSKGGWCMAIIPKRKIKFKKTDKGYFVSNDPLHPDGMEWVRVD